MSKNKSKDSLSFLIINEGYVSFGMAEVKFHSPQKYFWRFTGKTALRHSEVAGDLI